MNNRILGLFKDGPERGGAHRASGPAPPRPSFDEEFRGVRVCLIGNRIYFDWGDGEQTALNMERCDQLMLGDSSRETPAGSHCASGSTAPPGPGRPRRRHGPDQGGAARQQ
ncbi:hypothetical protein HFP72_04955 [Nocardiopsis sp. ARC36]